MTETLKAPLKRILPARVWRWGSLARWHLPRILRNRRDLAAYAAFIGSPTVRIPRSQRIRIVRQIYAIASSVTSPHTGTEIMSYVTTITALPENSSGIVVEAGCYKGISTAKFSLAAAAAGKQLVVFDSFEGIPEHEEPHDETIFGRPAHFAQGEYAWGLEGVRANVSKHGCIDCCRFVAGWFDDTLPAFEESIAAAYLDVDLASSTRTCIKYLYPLLEPGGVMYSQDGHLPLVIAALDDDRFWLDDVGCRKPEMVGLGSRKLVKIMKAPVG